MLFQRVDDIVLECLTGIKMEMELYTWKGDRPLVGVLVCGTPKTSSQGASVTWALMIFSHGCQALSEKRFMLSSNGFAPAVTTASFASLTFLAASSHADLRRMWCRFWVIKTNQQQF